MAPKIVFYARVSTRDQKPDSQIAAARRLGVKDAHIFVERASGVRHDRPVLDKALAALEKGDTRSVDALCSGSCVPRATARPFP